MNKRILKIDRDSHWSHNDEPRCVVQFRGVDRDGDTITIELKGEDAQEFLRLAQAIAAQETDQTDRILETLDAMRTLPNGEGP